MSSILENLNPSQKQAVEAITGPILVIAGAGSGKTKALTHRVAYLIREKKVSPKNILAVTFTNKAAQEMKERTLSLLGGDKSQLPLIGTFHSICVRILRSEIEKIGYQKSFNIFDTQDQESLMKKTMRELAVNIDQFKPKAILGTISKAKNELKDAADFSAQATGYYEEMVAKIYTAYQKKLQEQGALDFDDIIMLTVKILKGVPQVLEKYQDLFHYIMVDEYQDTNHAQYSLVRMLAEKWGNICVVGDDWQGIYSWRGANIQNILDFEKDYPAAKTVKLEQNYRSTQNILDAAYGVISKNINRKDKKIWTENAGGQLISIYEASNERDEANFVVAEIIKNKECNQASLNDFVVLYRTNAQSRIVEEAMLRNSLPYRIIGGLKFYQRKEVKDVIAYLRLAHNFNDEVSLGRVINEPRRSIGETTLYKWISIAKNNNIDSVTAGLQISNFQFSILPTGRQVSDSQISKQRADSIINFCEFIMKIKENIEKMTVAKLIEFVFAESGYEKSLLDGTDEGRARYDNVRELQTVAKKYDEYPGEDGLGLFLEEVALIADTDNINQSTESVHLMTLHSAKGLEFKTVFIIGLEEGIFPHSRSVMDSNEMEEERRLMYVGITRAKEKVYLLYTKERHIFGSLQVNSPSRFMRDIPDHLMDNFSTNQTSASLPQIVNRPMRAKTVRSTDYSDGDRVEHPIFGVGLIIASQGDILTIAFSQAGLKKLSASIAPLQKIS